MEFSALVFIVPVV